MGKHEKKSKKSRKLKHKKSKRRSTSSSSSSSNDNWVEKDSTTSTIVTEDVKEKSSEIEREEWMSLPTMFATSRSTGADRKKERDQAKLKERELTTYDPSKSTRELNPYWKKGGDGLPSLSQTKSKFIKPNIEESTYRSSHKSRSSRPSWRKKSPERSSPERNSSKSSESSPRISEIRNKIEESKSDTRQLNPYWKKGGDGLPSLSQTKSKFIKPNIEESTYRSSHKSRSSRPSWREKSLEISSHREPERNSSESSPRITETQNKIEESKSDISDCLTDKEMNDIGAKIVKAEIMGQTSKVTELKEKLERAREYRNNHPNTDSPEESVILYRTDSKGFSKPLSAPETKDNHKRKKNKIETHDAGKRQKYFPDDDKYSLKQMYESEKFNTTHQQDAEFIKLTSKVSKMDDMDDMFVDKIRSEKSTEKNLQKEKDRAIAEHHRMTESLNNCKKCLQSSSMDKHLMISLGENVYLSLPPHEPLTEGHCLLIPNRHVSCSTQLDENEWTEITDFRKALTNLFLAEDNDIIFYETVLNSHSYSHMVINCVPVPREQGDLAPIYFKKAIDECETEWTTNKKLVNLAGKDVRRAIPKGLPYFFVSFGMNEGFAHVIEDQRYFPPYFAAEIIGGILDLHHSKWRKPRFEKFDQQKSRVLRFSNQWKEFDCTIKN